jgi:hypothetical protein
VRWLWLISGELLVAPGRRRRHDKMQEGVADLGVWSPSSIASRCRRERQLEMCGVRVSFDRGRVARFPAKKFKDEGSGRCVGAREIEGNRNRAASDLVLVGISGAHHQYLRASTRNSATAS